MSDRETILVVEDEPALRQLIARALAHAGYRIHEARTGAEAEQVFLRHGQEIDLLITDLNMPGVGGVELIDLLRAQRRTLKVICISGYRTAPSTADAFIAKPFARENLLALIDQVLGH